LLPKKKSNNNKEKEETDKKIKTDERTQQKTSTMGRPDDAKIIGDESMLKQKSKEDTFQSISLWQATG
jgi:hypothetical protein